MVDCFQIKHVITYTNWLIVAMKVLPERFHLINHQTKTLVLFKGARSSRGRELCSGCYGGGSG